MNPAPITRPSASYLLRVLQRVETRRVVQYELQDLASGRRYSFASLAALRRFLARPPADGGAETTMR